MHFECRIQVPYSNMLDERRILIVVRERNKKYDKSLTFSITVDVPERNFAIYHSCLLLKNHDTFLIKVSTGCTD